MGGEFWEAFFVCLFLMSIEWKGLSPSWWSKESQTCSQINEVSSSCHGVWHVSLQSGEEATGRSQAEISKDGVGLIVEQAPKGSP